MPAITRLTTLAAALVLAAACGGKPDAPAVRVDAERLANADADPGNWMSHGRSYAEDRFSPLDKINTKTAKLRDQR